MDSSSGVMLNVSDPNVLNLLMQFPLASPPPGVKANFVNPTFYGHGLVITGAICLPVLTIVLIIRSYVKFCVIKKITLDDYIYWISWPAGIVFICLSMALINVGGYGYHAWDLQLKDIIRPQNSNLAKTLSILQGPLMWLMKLTLFSFLLTAFAPLRWTRTLVYAGVVVSFLVYLSNGIVGGVFCNTPNEEILQSLVAGKGRAFQCASPKGTLIPYNMAVSIFTVVLDFYILLIPIPAIWKLQLSKKNKIGVYFVMLTGLGACVASIVVVLYRYRLFKSQDLTFNLVHLTTASTIETTVCLLVPCSASIARLYRHLKLKFSSSTPTPASSYLRSDSRANRKPRGHDRLGEGSLLMSQQSLAKTSSGVSSSWVTNGASTSTIQVDVRNEQKSGDGTRDDDVERMGGTRSPQLIVHKTVDYEVVTSPRESWIVRHS